MAEPLPPLATESYISLETFRRDGSGVKTPVWAAPLDGKLVVFSAGGAYKVKRIRNNPKARVAACNVRGSVRGPWIDATCREITDPAAVNSALGALHAKYGWQMWLSDVGAKLSGRFAKRAYLEIAF